jgi:uncharacterized protein YjeT (DUF2065 family)
MTELLLAVALMLVLEGCLYALFPDGMRRAMQVVLELPSSTIRSTGLVVALAGLVLAWLIRG